MITISYLCHYCGEPFYKTVPDDEVATHGVCDTCADADAEIQNKIVDDEDGTNWRCGECLHREARIVYLVNRICPNCGEDYTSWPD